LFYNLPGNITERPLDLLTGTGHKEILTGDFNAKHAALRARRNNTAGQSLLNQYYKNDYIISAPSQPTHFPDRNPAGAEVLDFAILSKVHSNHSISTLGSLSTSDHGPFY
jgi:endonuclease/exonuclease/phosphatase family metal-dependent hydrolase